MRRPRVRNVEERFESRVLPLFARKSKKVADLIPELYLHGLAEGDFDLALRGLLGDEARVSASTVARLKEKWHAELAEWRQRPLDDLEVVYMWVDGVYVKAGLEKEKAAILVVLSFRVVYGSATAQHPPYGGLAAGMRLPTTKTPQGVVFRSPGAFCGPLVYPSVRTGLRHRV